MLKELSKSLLALSLEESNCTYCKSTPIRLSFQSVSYIAANELCKGNKRLFFLHSGYVSCDTSDVGCKLMLTSELLLE